MLIQHFSLECVRCSCLLRLDGLVGCTDVVKPASHFVVRGTFREVGLCNEFVSLVEEIVEEIVAQNEVEKSSLSFKVRTQSASAQTTVQKSVKQKSLTILLAQVVKIYLCKNTV